MDLKKIVACGVIGGIWLLMMTFISSSAAGLVAPYNMAEIGGMRSIDDPIMFLFFGYPFVLAFMASLVFALTGSAIRGTVINRGITFGLVLLMLVTIPNQFVIYTSMTYPLGFFISNILAGLIGFPVLGIIIAAVFERTI
ncbi:MAG TPA: hypothetical protein VN455_09240 [Methanotrichaceae archaeon]|nr:hypothetical protein [Methanotrichaceae archaeon]